MNGRILRIIAFLAGVGAAQAYAAVAYNGHFYDIAPVGSWTDAQSYANSMGGHLVTIDDAAENEFLATSFLTVTGSEESFWIGLFSPTGTGADDGDYVWASGASSGYRNWRDPSQPDVGTGDDRFAVINAELSSSGAWDNFSLAGLGGGVRGIFEFVPIPADSNGDTVVDGLDYLTWAAHFGDDPADPALGTPTNGDYNDDGRVDGLDYLVWAGQFGSGGTVTLEPAHMPEPASLWMFGLIGALLIARRCTRSSQ